jgi:hypothetical protein
LRRSTGRGVFLVFVWLQAGPFSLVARYRSLHGDLNIARRTASLAGSIANFQVL